MKRIEDMSKLATRLTSVQEEFVRVAVQSLVDDTQFWRQQYVETNKRADQYDIEYSKAGITNYLSWDELKQKRDDAKRSAAEQLARYDASRDDLASLLANSGIVKLLARVGLDTSSLKQEAKRPLPIMN
jgi:hypothetical protein